MYKAVLFPVSHFLYFYVKVMHLSMESPIIPPPQATKGHTKGFENLLNSNPLVIPYYFTV